MRPTRGPRSTSGSLTTTRSGSSNISNRQGQRTGSVATSNHQGRGSLAGLTIGARGNRGSGAIHIGSNRSQSGLHGTISLDRHGNDHHDGGGFHGGSSLHGGGGHHGRQQFYGSAYGGFYYRDYSPIHGYNLGYSLDHHYPYYGYSYASAYYPDPYLYGSGGSGYGSDGGDVYYADQIVETQIVQQGPPAPQAVAPSGTTVAPGEQDTYQALIAPGDNTLVGQGNTAFVAGQYDEARRFYATAMLADERDGYAKFLYALANFTQGDYQVGGMAIRRALLTTPELIEFPVDIRGLYRDPVLLDGQIAKLVRFVSDHPDNRGAALLLGYVYYAAGQPDRALVVVERLATTDQNDSMAALLRDAIVRVSREKKPE